jgi:holliday junction resolvase Hjr
MSKAKGSRAERELFHKLWDVNYAVLRTAGSGSTTKPAPDLLASNGKRTLAIECKSIKDTKKYFDKEELEQLHTFSTLFGAESWIGIRFDNKGWYFVLAENIPLSKGERFVVSFDFMQKQGKSFEELLGTYQQNKLI